jgi:hypothetical protein
VKVAAWCILGVGVALRLIAWTGRSSLWLDEVAIALNVNSRSLWNLLSVPLDFGQAAPKGFLLAQWLITRVLGASDLAYRLLPFVAGVAALFLFRNVARRLLSEPGATVALLFFAVGFWFVDYSADAKPYMVDVALSLLVLRMTFELRDSGYVPARARRLALAGFVSVWLSNGTVITLVGLALALLVVAIRERGVRPAMAALWPIGVAWGAGSAIVAWLALRAQFPGMVSYLHRSNEFLFAPVPRDLDSALWFWRTWRSELAMWHGWAIGDSRWTSLFPALALIGLAGIVWRRRLEGLILLAPIAAFMAASIAGRYPYGSRFALFPLSLLLIGIGEAVDRVAHLATGRLTTLARGAALIFCVPPLYFIATYPPPYPWTAVGSYLASIRAQWRRDDVLYVSFGRALEVMYHAPRFGIDQKDVTLGPCNYADPRAALRSVDSLRGRSRVWAIVDPGDAFPWVEYAYLRTIGFQRESLAVQPTGTRRLAPVEPYDIETAYLFDLSDSTRLARATAATYRRSPWLARQVSPALEWQCRGVFAPNVRESDSYTGRQSRDRTAQ